MDILQAPEFTLVAVSLNAFFHTYCKMPCKCVPYTSWKIVALFTVLVSVCQ